MTNCKLVPFAPTPEMVEAAEDAYMPFGDMDLAIRMAILAAPVVQGEPVYFWREIGESDWMECGKDWYWKCVDNPEHDTKLLYSEPAARITEQQPSAGDSLTSVPDEAFAAEFAVWWDERGQFCRSGGGTYERTFAFEAWRHLYPQLMNLRMAAAEQQPAPDVAGLVEALGCILSMDDEINIVDVMDPKAREMVEIARDALAELEKRNG